VEALVQTAEFPLNAGLLLESLGVFQELATGTSPVGFVDAAAMQQTLELLKRYGGVKTDFPASEFYSNDFIGRAITP